MQDVEVTRKDRKKQLNQNRKLVKSIQREKHELQQLSSARRTLREQHIDFYGTAGDIQSPMDLNQVLSLDRQSIMNLRSLVGSPKFDQKPKTGPPGKRRAMHTTRDGLFSEFQFEVDPPQRRDSSSSPNEESLDECNLPLPVAEKANSKVTRRVSKLNSGYSFSSFYDRRE